MTKESNNKRIAKNTLLLYFRMFLTMGVSLYTSRVVLEALGVNDYGIYNVVGGVVLMFSSINTTMAIAVQRFMNFEMGHDNVQKLNRVFNTSIIIHIFIALIIFVLIETIGVWFLNYKMNIDPLRMNAANWVLQFSILTFMTNILSVPYNAVIIANERMKAFAYISIVEVSLKLLLVFSLTWFSFDRLVQYAILMFCVAFILRVIYGVYAKRNFKECDFHWYWNKSLFKEMLSFAGWNMVGVTSTLVRTEGLNIVLNLFFGTVVNAAMGISNQVKNTLQGFTENFITAINPQITKSYASGDLPYLMTLVFNGSRFAFYLLLFIALPIIIETNYVLNVWLKTIPDSTVIFIRLVLITSIIEALSKTLIQAMFATGNIRKYQIIVGSITLLNLPIAIALFYAGFPPFIALVVGVVIAIISLFLRLKMLEPMIQLSTKRYYKDVLYNVFIVTVLAVIIPLLEHFYMPYGFIRFVVVGISCCFSISIAIYKIGLTNAERVFVLGRLGKILNN